MLIYLLKRPYGSDIISSVKKKGDDGMYRQKLALNLSATFELDMKEQISLIKKTGFEEIFIDATDGKTDVPPLVKKAAEESIGIQSLHAPFDKSAVMWNESGEEAGRALEELLYYIELCAEYEIPVAVTHAFIGFYTGRKPTTAGVERYGAAAKRASELGVKLALENTEGDEFLDTLFRELRSEKSVGFCWDSGHEQCYNHGRDLLALYGDRLWGTHLNDNLGISDYNGRLTFWDDLHLMPFDGIIDWNDVAARLAKCGFDGTLTFELKRIGRTERTDSRKYEKMPPDEYIAEAYSRACRVAALKLRADASRNKNDA